MKTKLIDHIRKIMPKHQGVFTKNLTIFISNARKTGNAPEFKFDEF